MEETDMAKLAYASVINAIAECEDYFDGEILISYPDSITINDTVYKFMKQEDK